MILDTNAVSALLKSDPALSKVLGRSSTYLPVHVIGEYRYGVLSSKYRLRLDALFRELIEESIILESTVNTAGYYATIRFQLRMIGQPIPETDIWIAALALEHELPVVTRDEHFDRIEGLTRLGW